MKVPDFKTIEDPQKVSKNMEKPRAWYVPYTCRCGALNGAHALSDDVGDVGFFK